MSERRVLLAAFALLLVLALLAGGIAWRWKAGEAERRYERLIEIDLSLCLSQSVSKLDTNACLDDYAAKRRQWDAR